MNPIATPNAGSARPFPMENRPKPTYPIGSIGALLSSLQQPDDDVLQVELLDPYAIPALAVSPQGRDRVIGGRNFRQPSSHPQQPVGHRHMESPVAGGRGVAQFLTNPADLGLARLGRAPSIGAGSARADARSQSSRSSTSFM